MAVSVAEIIVRRKLEKQNDIYFQPGQHKAVMVEDKALLSWVDSVGQVIMLTATKEETSPGVEEWVAIKPAFAVLIALDGTIQARPFAVSYRFDEHQTNALNEALKSKKKPKRQESVEEVTP